MSFVATMALAVIYETLAIVQTNVHNAANAEENLCQAGVEQSQKLKRKLSRSGC